MKISPAECALQDSSQTGQTQIMPGFPWSPHSAAPIYLESTQDKLFPNGHLVRQKRDQRMVKIACSVPQGTAAFGAVPDSNGHGGAAGSLQSQVESAARHEAFCRRPLWQRLAGSIGSKQVAPDLKVSSLRDQDHDQFDHQPPTAVVTARSKPRAPPRPALTPMVDPSPPSADPAPITITSQTHRSSRSSAITKDQPHSGSTAGSHSDALWSYVVQHGRSIMSLSGILQDGLQYFVLPGVGYIAYTMMHNGPEILNILTPVALGDPVCAQEDYEMIAGQFLQRFPKAMFVQISQVFALVLKGLGMLTNSIGGETHIDIEKYTFSGYAKRGLRSAIASAQKEGITVEEVMKAPMAVHTAAAAGGCSTPPAAAAADWSVVAAEMFEVDQSWVKHKGERAGRVWFINRPPVLAPEPGVRKFIARDGSGRLQAFIFLDAVYDGGNITGYYANVTRIRPDAHPGVLNLIIKEVIDRIRSECKLTAPVKNTSVKKSKRKKQQQQQQDATAADINPAPEQHLNSPSSSSSSGPKFLSLGLSPLHQMIDCRPLSHSRFIRRLFEFAFKEGSGFYPFHSLAAAKAKYGAGLHDGQYEDPNVTYSQVYLAHRQRNTACMGMFDLGKLLGFWSTPVDAALAFSGHKVEEKARALGKGIRKKLKGRKTAAAGSSSSGNGRGSSIVSKSSSSSRGSEVECSSSAEIHSSSSSSSSGSSRLWFKLKGKLGSSSSSSSRSHPVSISTAAGATSGNLHHNGAWDNNDEQEEGCFLFIISSRRRRQQRRPGCSIRKAAAAPGMSEQASIITCNSSISSSIRVGSKSSTFKNSIKPMLAAAAAAAAAATTSEAAATSKVAAAEGNSSEASHSSCTTTYAAAADQEVTTWDAHTGCQQGLGLNSTTSNSSNSSSSGSSGSSCIRTAHGPCGGSSSSSSSSSSSIVNSSGCLNSYTSQSGSSAVQLSHSGVIGIDTSSNSSSNARKDSIVSEASSYASAVDQEWRELL